MIRDALVVDAGDVRLAVYVSGPPEAPPIVRVHGYPDSAAAHTPVQFIVPLRDRYVGPALSLGLERWLGDYTRDTIDAGHWVVLRDAPGIAARIDAFAAMHPIADGSVSANRAVNESEASA